MLSTHILVLHFSRERDESCFFFAWICFNKKFECFNLVFVECRCGKNICRSFFSSYLSVNQIKEVWSFLNTKLVLSFLKEWYFNLDQRFPTGVPRHSRMALGGARDSSIYHISIDIRLILTHECAVKYLNNPVRVP